jgi:hypothetical protein
MDNKESKKPITIYHLHFEKLPRNGELQNKDFYFGSISAIYEVFNKNRIGIQASSLYNFKLDKDNNPIYKNDKCWIRKDILISKSQRK